MNLRYAFVLFVFILLACSKKTTNFYQGFVLDENNRPIENVRVIESYTIEKMTKTDKSGYFKLNRKPDRLASLVFFKDGYETDTIPAVWSRYGERVQYHFIHKDTTRVTLRTAKQKKLK